MAFWWIAQRLEVSQIVVQGSVIMPQSGDSFSYLSGSFPQFDHTSMVDAHAHWKEWKPLMQSFLHSVVLGHILAGANMDFTAADLLSAWIYKANPALFYLPGFFCIASLHVDLRKDKNKIVRMVFFTRRSKHHFGDAFATILANLMLSLSLSAILCLLPVSERLRMVIK